MAHYFTLEAVRWKAKGQKEEEEKKMSLVIDDSAMTAATSRRARYYMWKLSVIDPERIGRTSELDVRWAIYNGVGTVVVPSEHQSIVKKLSSHLFSRPILTGRSGRGLQQKPRSSLHIKSVISLHRKVEGFPSALQFYSTILLCPAVPREAQGPFSFFSAQVVAVIRRYFRGVGSGRAAHDSSS